MITHTNKHAANEHSNSNITYKYMNIAYDHHTAIPAIFKIRGSFYEYLHFPLRWPTWD